MESYILSHYQSFDAVRLLESTCSDLSRDNAAYQFETTVHSLSTKELCPEAVKKWCKNVKQYKYEVVNTDEAVAYWEIRNRATKQLNTNLFHAELDAAASSRLLAVSSSMQRKVLNITRMKRKAETPKMEADSLLFNGVSVGTTIKRHSEALAGLYKELNNKQKTRSRSLSQQYHRPIR
ncbi:hypothetical protein A0J61_11533 [Choanephora cucurbitarum]|uniref:Uncharacterized protein n=1 Tax=Choanephora cucurbitarum TaxID=101091 RepID=A0A1C7MVF0_9FUNG|nr:hypothetical protein A0J61_11533 [Choanephora cucurbitarum]